MAAELALSSWETAARRLLMMASGTCSAAELARMASEKAWAGYRSALSLASQQSQGAASAALAPWHRKAVANAKRLRKRR